MQTDNRGERQQASLRVRLSRETADVHEALHSHPRLIPLSEKSISKPQFTALIGDYLAIYSALESRRAAMNWCVPLTLAAPVAALEADMVAFCSPSTIKRCFTAMPETEAHCLGALYVMLGAQFGARVLTANLAEAIPGPRSAYFAPCTQTLAVWRNLLRLLENVRRGSQDEASIISGAHAMFEELGRFLSGAPGFPRVGQQNSPAVTHPIALAEQNDSAQMMPDPSA